MRADGIDRNVKLGQIFNSNTVTRYVDKLERKNNRSNTVIEIQIKEEEKCVKYN